MSRFKYTFRGSASLGPPSCAANSLKTCWYSPCLRASWQVCNVAGTGVGEYTRGNDRHCLDFLDLLDFLDPSDSAKGGRCSTTTRTSTVRGSTVSSQIRIRSSAGSRGNGWKVAVLLVGVQGAGVRQCEQLQDDRRYENASAPLSVCDAVQCVMMQVPGEETECRWNV